MSTAGQGETSANAVRLLSPAEVALTAAVHAADLVGPTGQFRYGYDPQTGASTPGYNLLRHCALIWAMGEIGRTFERGDVLEAASRAMNWVLTERVHSSPRGSACIFEADKKAKLGGAGLGILALTALSPSLDRPEYRDTATGFGHFIRDMRRRNGSFHNLIDIRTGKTLRKRSAHYTGEALLGLFRLARATGDMEWRDLAVRTIDALAPRDFGVREPSPWFVYALSEMHRETGRHLDYAGRIVRRVLVAPRYRGPNETVPVACALEILASYASRVGGHSGPFPAGVPSFDDVVAHARTDAESVLKNRLPTGAFRHSARNRRVQIDQIQHAASAFFGLHSIGLSGLQQHNNPLD